jgi:streptogramin lyase
VPAEDCLWITSEDEGGVLRRVDRATHEVTTVGKFPLVDSAVLAFGYLWLSARDGGGVWKLDPSTDEVLDQTKLSRPAGMVEHGDRHWITLQDGVLTSIDPGTLEVISDTDLGHDVLGPPILAFGSLWTAALDENLVLRVDVARIGYPKCGKPRRLDCAPGGRLAARRRMTSGAVAQSVRAEDS